MLSIHQGTRTSLLAGLAACTLMGCADGPAKRGTAAVFADATDDQITQVFMAASGNNWSIAATSVIMIDAGWILDPCIVTNVTWAGVRYELDPDCTFNGDAYAILESGAAVAEGPTKAKWTTEAALNSEPVTFSFEDFRLTDKFSGFLDERTYSFDGTISLENVDFQTTQVVEVDLETDVIGLGRSTTHADIEIAYLTTKFDHWTHDYQPGSWGEVEGLGSFLITGSPYSTITLVGKDTLRFDMVGGEEGCIGYEVDGRQGEICI